MIKEIYSIKTLTNMHVGSGDTNYGVIDNLVQKDLNTNLATINTSSLKGALREYFKKDKSLISTVFGDEKKPGTWRFLSADLISRPLRSNKAPYFNATSMQVLKNFVNKAIELGVLQKDHWEGFFRVQSVENGHPIVINESYNGAIIEEYDWKADYNAEFCNKVCDSLKTLIGDNIVIVNDSDFLQLDLPVIARNHLENGESQNLWYEEIVPYDSRFVFFVLRPENDIENFNKFSSGLKKPIQIGANASIGYGLCKINCENSTSKITNDEKN